MFLEIKLKLILKEELKQVRKEIKYLPPCIDLLCG